MCISSVDKGLAVLESSSSAEKLTLTVAGYYACFERLPFIAD